MNRKERPGRSATADGLVKGQQRSVTAENVLSQSRGSDKYETDHEGNEDEDSKHAAYLEHAKVAVATIMEE